MAEVIEKMDSIEKPDSSEDNEEESEISRNSVHNVNRRSNFTRSRNNTILQEFDITAKVSAFMVVWWLDRWNRNDLNLYLVISSFFPTIIIIII